MAGFALLAAGVAWAGPRDAPELATATFVEDTAPDAWMQRLQGRFAIEGAIQHDAEIENRDGRMVEFVPDPERGESQDMGRWTQPVATGKADCIGIAESAGLHCLVYLDWSIGDTGLPEPPAAGISRVAPDTEIHNSPPSFKMGMGASSLRPGMVLAGVAPSSPGTVRILLVDDKGLAHPATLSMSGDAAIAKPPCINQPGRMTCAQRFRVEARPGSPLVFVTFEIETTYIISRSPKPGVQDNHRSMTRFEERLQITLSLRREAQAADIVPAVHLPGAQSGTGN